MCLLDVFLLVQSQLLVRNLTLGSWTLSSPQYLAQAYTYSPSTVAGLVTTPKGLIALRFFIGILGASFVPCQVWCTGFFDKNVVGTANALAGGWGNSGGGITVSL